MTTLHNKRTAARVIYRDDERDLVLLELDAKSDFSVAVSDIQSGTVRADELGKLLISTNPLNEGKISVLGTTGFTLPAVYSIGYLGMRLEDGKNVIASVQPNTAADKAGLKAGDVILDINRIQVENSTAFVKELKNKRPYEVISVVRVRDNKRDTLDITLQSRPFQGINHLAEEFTDGRSERRDGFGNVFIHDAKLKPSECGGPVFDLNKKMMGINIARYSRTSSLGIPGKEVIEFLKSAFSKK